MGYVAADTLRFIRHEEASPGYMSSWLRVVEQSSSPSTSPIRFISSPFLHHVYVEPKSLTIVSSLLSHPSNMLQASANKLDHIKRVQAIADEARWTFSFIVSQQ